MPKAPRNPAKGQDINPFTCSSKAPCKALLNLVDRGPYDESQSRKELTKKTNTRQTLNPGWMLSGERGADAHRGFQHLKP